MPTQQVQEGESFQLASQKIFPVCPLSQHNPTWAEMKVGPNA